MGILHTCMNVSDADELADWYVHTVGQKFSHATLPESTSIHPDTSHSTRLLPDRSGERASLAIQPLAW